MQKTCAKQQGYVVKGWFLYLSCFYLLVVVYFLGWWVVKRFDIHLAYILCTATALRSPYLKIEDSSR